MFDVPDELTPVDLGPALLGGVVGLAAPLIVGAVVASYTPRKPVQGALLSAGLSIGLGVLGAGLVSVSAASAARAAGGAAGAAAGSAAGATLGEAARRAMGG